MVFTNTAFHHGVEDHEIHHLILLPPKRFACTTGIRPEFGGWFCVLPGQGAYAKRVFPLHSGFEPLQGWVMVALSQVRVEPPLNRPVFIGE